MSKGLLLKLFVLAFKTRYTLPLLISAAFMVLDYQLTIEVEVEGKHHVHSDDAQSVAAAVLPFLAQRVFAGGIPTATLSPVFASMEAGGSPARRSKL